MIEEIKELRIQIDGLAQLTKDLKPIVGMSYLPDHKINSEEIRKSIDNLLLAKAWLGKILGELGTKNPYKSGYKTKEDIEPTADIAKNLTIDVDGGWEELNHIERVDWLRTEIQKIIDNTSDFSQEEINIELEQGFVYKYLSEARFWLGFELQRIKEAK